ncbi:hypothetical protein J1N35_000366 [Gossypium stocksii]|uniref:Secreted protein n=1 Tax=Gossypium stocksii TaxID=47602 RepID=A0A9D4AKQ8_9ROSI|nr:hypothetical protein J1N35_000366 [Gossypium stocksii]
MHPSAMPFTLLRRLIIAQSGLRCPVNVSYWGSRSRFEAISDLIFLNGETQLQRSRAFLCCHREDSGCTSLWISM